MTKRVPATKRRLRSGIVVGLLVVSATCVWTMRGVLFAPELFPPVPFPPELFSPVPPPTAVAAGDLATSSAAVPGATAGELEAASATETERANRDVVAAAGVYGRLLDNRGEPLAGFQVLFKLNESFREKPVTVGADGKFAFPIVVAGEYTLSTAPFDLVAQRLTLVVGERREIDLRLSAEQVAVTFRILRRGQLETSSSLWLMEDGRRAFQPSPDPDGLFRIVLRAGSRSVGIENPATPIRKDRPCFEQIVSIPADASRCERTLTMLATDLVVTVLDELGSIALNCRVMVRGEKHPFYPHEWANPVRPEGAAFSCLPPGEYEVLVLGQDVFVPPSQHITVPAGDQQLALQFAVARAAPVRLVLRSRGQVVNGLPPESMPVLHDHDRDIHYTLLGSSKAQYRHRRFGFANVLPGLVTLHCADRLVEDELQYLAFEPIEPQSFAVVLGRENQIELQVEPRAMVDLRACETGGREQFGATIEVFAGEQKVRSHPVLGCQRFLSHLPPGDYRIVIDRGGQIREHSLLVARQDVRLRLRP